MTRHKEPVGLGHVVEQISRTARQLLEDGAEPSMVTFVLTSVATDMGLELTNDPLKLFPLLLEAIADQTKCRLRKEQERAVLDIADEGPAEGTTIH